jgi:hypothetical protein
VEAVVAVAQGEIDGHISTLENFGTQAVAPADDVGEVGHVSAYFFCHG